jgi:CHASE3 domain sensor protein
MKIDKKVLAESVGICCLSWLAIPVIYFLIQRKKKDTEEVKEEEKEVKE